MILQPVQEPLIKLTTLNDHRPKYQDVCFAVIYLILNVAALVMQVVFIIRGLHFITWYDCLEGFSTDLPVAVFTVGVAGALRNGGGSVLGLAITTCFFFSALWIYSLRVCAKPIVWGTYILGWCGVLAFILYVKSISYMDWASASLLVPFLFLFISGVAIMVRRESINRAARVMATACTALGENSCLFVFTFVLQLFQLLYFGFYMYSALNSYFAYPILSTEPASAYYYGNPTCGFVDRTLVDDSMSHFSPPRDWVHIGAYFSASIFLWNVFFGDALRLYVTTGVMAEWFFNSDERRRGTCSTVARFWKWALTVQLGTIAVSALVSTVIQKLKNWAKINGCGCCCPHVWIARIVLCMIQSCVATLTRFNLAYAAISGDGFARSVKNSYDVIFGAFGDAITNELTAAVVLNFATLIFSCAVGLLAWVATAFQLNEGVFVFVDILVCDDGSSFCSTFNTVIHTIMFGFSGWVAYNTLLGLFLLIMFPAIWTSTLGPCVYMGVLSMLIARLIFTFVGGLIQDSTTGMYMCAAIDKQNGTISPKRHFIDEVMKEEHCPAAWYTTVAATPVSAISVYTTPPVQLYQAPMPHLQPPPPPPVSYQTYQQSYPHQQFQNNQFQYPATPTFQPTPLSPYQLASPQTPYAPQTSYSTSAHFQPHFQPSLPPSTAPLADAPPPYVHDSSDFTFNCKSCQTPIADDARFCGKCGLSR